MISPRVISHSFLPLVFPPTNQLYDTSILWTKLLLLLLLLVSLGRKVQIPDSHPWLIHICDISQMFLKSGEWAVLDTQSYAKHKLSKS